MKLLKEENERLYQEAKQKDDKFKQFKKEITMRAEKP